ncbi:hypothetical protein [Ekhidna sp.]|uniref:hypothetical protein n=1 Tax=Ekhidna sp. TaxID=2608089 RepID=UPI003B51183A
MHKSFIFSILIILSLCGNSQYSIIDVLERLDSLQVDQNDFYDSGLFPCQRSWSFSNNPVEDNTIFFSASIAFTLREIYPLLDSGAQLIAHQIIAGVGRNYQKYRSRKSEATFNFWQTIAPDLPFPNGGRLISNEGMRLPDDYDTSCLIALAAGNDSVSLNLRKAMVEYANRANRNENEPTTLNEYKDSQAYEVWYAKEMPQTFDICVMSNALLFVVKNGFELNGTDSATFELIQQMIRNDDHLTNTKFISHHATSPALILYHVSRLIKADSLGILNDLNRIVIEDLLQLLDESENEMEKVLILTSLFRLGHSISEAPNFDELSKDLQSFIFFSVKPFGSGFSSLRLDGISPTIDWYCEAYNWALVLEYLVLSEAN